MSHDHLFPIYVEPPPLDKFITGKFYHALNHYEDHAIIASDPSAPFCPLPPTDNLHYFDGWMRDIRTVHGFSAHVAKIKQKADEFRIGFYRLDPSQCFDICERIIMEAEYFGKRIVIQDTLFTPHGGCILKAVDDGETWLVSSLDYCSGAVWSKMATTPTT